MTLLYMHGKHEIRVKRQSFGLKCWFAAMSNETSPCCSIPPVLRETGLNKQDYIKGLCGSITNVFFLLANLQTAEFWLAKKVPIMLFRTPQRNRCCLLLILKKKFSPYSRTTDTCNTLNLSIRLLQQQRAPGLGPRVKSCPRLWLARGLGHTSVQIKFTELSNLVSQPGFSLAERELSSKVTFFSGW